MAGSADPLVRADRGVSLGSSRESADDSEIESHGNSCHHVKFGRIWAFYICGAHLYVGPHWYCSLIMLLMILGLGYLFVNWIAVLVGTPHVIGGVCVTFLSVVSFLRCALADPGILRKHNDEDSERDLPAPSGAGRQCRKCDLPQPRGCSHCDYCQVCVEGFDHHCPWMGKCIGKNNLYAFYTFIAVSFSSLGYILCVTMTVPPNLGHDFAGAPLMVVTTVAPLVATVAPLAATVAPLAQTFAPTTPMPLTL